VITAINTVAPAKPTQNKYTCSYLQYSLGRELVSYHLATKNLTPMPNTEIQNVHYNMLAHSFAIRLVPPLNSIVGDSLE